MLCKEEDFEIVGRNKKLLRYNETIRKVRSNKPYISMIILIVIIIGSFIIPFITNKNPNYMNLESINIPPSKDFYFGTDSMGRNLFFMIWNGCRVSLTIGFLSTIISSFIGIIYGTISGLTKESIDNIMMRAVEIILSLPSILIIIFLQGIIDSSKVLSISLVIGATSWMGISKVVRMEVKQIRNKEYIMLSRMMGGSIFHILKEHLLPNFISSIMFIIVNNIRMSILMESTLSFLGIGLPLNIISLGSILSLSQESLLSNKWWIVVIPGVFLIMILVSISNLGNYIRRVNDKVK